jgi:hypothetical protein
MGIYSGPLNPVDGLVLYLDASNNASYSGSGNTWYDLSGNSNKATFADSPSFQSLPQSYFNFDGVNDYMTIVRSSSMSPTSALTQEVWFNFSIVPNVAIFIGLQYGTSTNNTYALWKDSSLLYGGVNTSGSFSYIGIGTSYMSGNKWHHFVHTYDGSAQKLYLDGVLLNSASITGSIQYDANNTRVLIGADDNGSGYNTGASYPHSGKLNQVRIYNRALSSEEVIRNYNAQKKRYFPEENIVRNGLVLNVDGASSSSYPGSGTSWFDISGSNNHLTLANGPAFTGTNGGIFTFDGVNDNANRAFTWPTDFTFDLFCKPISSGGGYHRIIGTGDVFEFAIGNGADIKYYHAGWTGTGVTITFGSYVQLCGVKSGSNFYIYKNSTLVYSGSITLTSVSFLYLSSKHNSAELVNSSIGAFKIYNRPLSATEIAQNYNALRGRYNI